MLKTSIWCCILTHIFFSLNTGENADPYIIKPLNLSSARDCDDEPEGTLFSWFWPILFIPHQSNVMGYSWLLAMNYICKNKQPSLYVHKKTNVKLSRPSDSLLGKWIRICICISVFHICILTLKGDYKCWFFNVHQSLWSLNVLWILIIMKIILFTLKQSGWLESNPKLKTTAEDFKNPNLQLQIGSFRNLQL